MPDATSSNRDRYLPEYLQSPCTILPDYSLGQSCLCEAESQRRTGSISLPQPTILERWPFFKTAQRTVRLANAHFASHISSASQGQRQLRQCLAFRRLVHECIGGQSKLVAERRIELLVSRLSIECFEPTKLLRNGAEKRNRNADLLRTERALFHLSYFGLDFGADGRT